MFHISAGGNHKLKAHFSSPIPPPVSCLASHCSPTASAAQGSVRPLPSTVREGLAAAPPLGRVLLGLQWHRASLGGEVTSYSQI